MGSEHEDELEARLARLEGRIARLEAALTAAPGTLPDQVPGEPASVGPPPPVEPNQPPPPASQWQPAPPTPSQVWPSMPVRASLPPRFTVSLADLEQQLAGRALAVVGGIALILGAIFFLSLAFSRGWIGPELRVVIGLVAGSVAVAAGAAFLERRNRLLGHVLVPVGLAVISISLMGATRLYGLIPTPLGLLGSLVAGSIAAIVAVRSESQQVAAFGLISVLLAPPLLGASADTTTLAFIGVTLIGTTSIALWRSWRWLPPIAFLLTVPQAAAWIGGDPDRVIALVGIGLFWALNVTAAGGEELRRRQDAASPSSATVLLGTAAFVVWAGFTVLDGSLEPSRGLYLIVVAAAHLALGWYLIARDGERNIFGLLTIGTGIATLTMAVPNQFDAPMVPVAWAAEAAALAWVASLRRHPYSAIVSGILYGLAAVAVTERYALRRDEASVLLDADIAALAFLLGAIAVGIWLVRDQSIRSGLAALAIGTAVYCGGTVLTGVAGIAYASELMVIAAALIPILWNGQRLDWIIDGLIPQQLRPLRWRQMLEVSLPIAIVLCGGIAAFALVAADLPIFDIGDRPLPALPFTDPGAVAAEILITAVLVAGWILGHSRAWSAAAEDRARTWHTALLIAGAIATYAVPFEVAPWAVVVLWAAFGVAGVVVAPRLAPSARAFRMAGGGLLLAAGLVALDVTSPRRLFVGDAAVPPDQMLTSLVSLGAVAAGFLIAGSSWSGTPRSIWIRSAAGFFAVYALSVFAVDTVGSRSGGSIDLEELRTQGQVTLSVLWAILGVLSFVYGLRRDSQDARLGGLALLGLATTKVFLFDLSALDVAYRVISFVALGLLLLAGAWVSQRVRPRRRPAVDPRTREPESPAA